MEKIEKISEEYEDYYGEGDNKVIRGILVLAKYTEDINLNPGHDEIWVGFRDKDWYEKMSEEDIREMFRLNYHWEEECFTTFT